MTKQKRSKSKTRPTAPEEEEPLADDSNTSLTKARFDELLKQAVEDSTLDAKARRRRRKQLDESVLDKLRNGEGLKKNEDQTLLANTFDPDDVKGGKSNKRRQKAREQNDEKENKKSHTNLAYEDETEPSSTKKKTKKTTTIERDSTIELAPQPATRRKGKKKINTEPESEGALSPSAEDELEPGTEKPTKKKKKKTKKGQETTTEHEQSEDPDRAVDGIDQSADTVLSDSTVEHTKVMKKKKKTKAKHKVSEEVEEVEAESEAPRSVEDEGRVIGVIVHRTDKLKTDFYISHPLVRVHLIDLDTGTHLKKQHKDRAVTSYYEKDTNVDFILPIMTFPFDFKQNKSVLPVWEETLVFNENYNFILQNQPNTMIFFELLDFVSINTARLKYKRDKHEGGWHRIAWAFLKVVGSTGTPNTERKVRLQLYQLPVRFKTKGEQNEVYQWYKMGATQRIAYPSTLYITVKGLVLPKTLSPAPRSLFATQAERGQVSFDEMQKTLDMGATSKRLDSNRHNPSLWSRLQGQVCKVPNSLHFTLPVSRKGCFVISFSPDGRSLACACHDIDSYPIIIYNIPEGTMKGQMLGHYGIIYDLHWTRDSKLLMSASSDGTARVWDGTHVTQTPAKLLPHPAYVYTARFHVRVQKVIVTGSYDRVIRIWSLQGSDQHAELIQELDGHLGYVNALSFDDEGGLLYSGDSQGQIRMWNAYCTDQPSKKGVLKDWTKNGEINEAEMDGTSINSMTLHPNGRRLLVHCRDNVIRMIDLRIRAIMQRYHGALNFREQIRSTISPCGTFIVSGSEDSTAYVWNAEAGDRVASYKELGYKSPVTDVAFHPHEHMVAFCSYGENHPVLVYKYDHAVAQRDAGLGTPVRMVTPRARTGQPASPEMLPEASKLALDGRFDLKQSTIPRTEDLDIGTMARLERVQRKLETVTAFGSSLAPDHPLGLPRAMSPLLGNTASMTCNTTFDSTAWYNQLPSDSVTTSNLPPSLFSPHAGHTSLQATITQQQQLAAEAEYHQVGGTRPGFSALGVQGSLQRPINPTYNGRAPTISVNTFLGQAFKSNRSLLGPYSGLVAPHSGGSSESLQSLPPSGKVTTKVVALYDYQAQRSDELTLVRGDAIKVLYKDNENWWMGELVDGQQGFFPANYVTGQSDGKNKSDSDADLLDEFRTPKDKHDSTEEELEEETKLKERMAAIISRSGELKIFSASATESDVDGTTSKKVRRKKKTTQSTSQASVSVEDETTALTPMKSSVRRKKKKTTIVEESEA